MSHTLTFLSHLASEQVDKIKHGNKVVLEQLESFRECFVFSHLKWFPHCNTAQLSDAYSEAVIVFYTNLQSGKIEEMNASAKTYVFAVAKKLLLNESRKEARYQSLDIEVSTEEQEQEKKQKLEYNQKEELVLEGLKEMGPQARQMLELLLIKGKSIKEVARIMNYSNTRSASTAKHKFIIKLKGLVAKKLIEWERNKRET